eukprot:13586534-Alexandrium_andersonii.AAC.1
MSASLVGSEMCIRDRPSAAIAQERAEAGESSEGRPSTKRKNARAGSISCLLYTSDAADDM